MSDIRDKIIAAATTAFIRYGVKRTSLAEIAKAAGVSRQSLYLNFSNKDEVLAACMARWIEDLLKDLETRWAESTTLSEKIDAYFDIGVRKPFALLQTMPDVTDILHGAGAQTNAVAENLDSGKASRLAAQIAPFGDGLTGTGTTTDAIATLIVRSSKEFASTAKDHAELDGLLATLKTMTLSTMQSTS